MHQQYRPDDVLWLIERPVNAPEVTHILNCAIYSPHGGWLIMVALRIFCQRRCCPGLKPARRNQRFTMFSRCGADPAHFTFTHGNVAVCPQLATFINPRPLVV